MTSRRAARAAQLAGVVDVRGARVPAELLDVHHRVWKSDRLTADWFDRHGLTWADRHREGVGLFWPRRYHAAVNAWATDVGMLDQYGRPDDGRLKQLGITVSGYGSLCRLALGRDGSIAEV